MRVSVCLLLCSLVHGGGCREMDVAAIAGESVQLQPVTWTESWVKISWQVTLDSGKTYRLLTANKGEAPHLRSVLHFTSRVTFHPENLSLQIDPVNKSDRGLYALEITAAGGHVDCTSFRVSVFERVRQPNLTVFLDHAQHGQCNLTLSCAVPGADAVTYSWSRGSSPIPPDREQQLHGNQSLLRLVIDADSNETFYRCNASNRASWGENTVELKSVCSFPAPGTDDNPPDNTPTIPLWAIVAGGLGLLLLLLTVLFLLLFCKRQKKRRSCEGGDRPITIYEEVEDPRTRSNTNANARSRVVGNTIYAEINTKPQAPDFTVYAAVQKVQDAPARPRRPQMPRSSSPSHGHLYS
ncbi:natural killer cell receptor 2B4-like isoform X2 [Pelodiscus sinensis]|uniref:natural killer cell receptor 2B4-like isoform X2 n=1 Tax=Pelodiscus sinensis TaxID=13735 RepID=UPI003F6AB8D3